MIIKRKTVKQIASIMVKHIGLTVAYRLVRELGSVDSSRMFRLSMNSLEAYLKELVDKSKSKLTRKLDKEEAKELAEGVVDG